jgi:hypothetical protein
MSICLADVSEFQPDINDAEYVKWSHAIMVRALYGAGHVDDAWYGGARRSALHAAGITFLGIYQYLVAGQSGASQAQAFHTLVGPIQKGEVFVADFEEGDKPMLTDWYNEMLRLYGTGITTTCGPIPALISARRRACCRCSGSRITVHRNRRPRTCCGSTPTPTTCPAWASRTERVRRHDGPARRVRLAVDSREPRAAVRGPPPRAAVRGDLV